LKAFAEQKTAEGKKEEGKATVGKMKELLANDTFTKLNGAELKLLSNLCEATIRKEVLPNIQAALKTEIESIKKARAAAFEAEREAKQSEKDAKLKEASKRKQEAEQGSSSSKRVGKRRAKM